MLTTESLNADIPLYVFLAIEFAEKVITIWEREYPEDMRPRKAIEAAKEWLKNPSTAAANDAYVAYAAAYTAGYTAAAARDAANDAAANAAAYAAASAASAAYTAHYAAAATHAAKALETDEETLIHEVILESLDWTLQYKVDNGQSFAQPELILDYLNEEQKQSFLFNLDAVA